MDNETRNIILIVFGVIFGIVMCIIIGTGISYAGKISMAKLGYEETMVVGNPSPVWQRCPSNCLKDSIRKWRQ